MVTVEMRHILEADDDVTAVTKLLKVDLRGKVFKIPPSYLL